MSAEPSPDGVRISPFRRWYRARVSDDKPRSLARRGDIPNESSHREITSCPATVFVRIKQLNLGEERSIQTVDDRKRNISLRISVLARILRNNFDRQVSALNVTRSQWAMIAVVAHQPGATQRMVADALEMSEASAGRLVDRLCTEGLLERRARDDDRRARAVYLTDAARPLLDRLSIIAEQNEDRLFRDFSDTELNTLRTLLDKLYCNTVKG